MMIKGYACKEQGGELESFEYDPGELKDKLNGDRLYFYVFPIQCLFNKIEIIKTMKQWYEELYKDYGVTYDRESFTQGTIGECDFLEQEINYNRNCKILDIGCGTGRHSIELAKRDL